MITAVPSFTPLSPAVSLHTPARHNVDAPLIVICTWMGATPRLIAKYTISYTELFPNSRILLIITSPINFFYTPTVRFRKLLEPALDVLLSARDIKLALYSNGGAYATSNLAWMYAGRTGRPLPATAMVLDSAPGNSDVIPAYNAALLFLPPFITRPPFIYLISPVIWIMLVMFALITAVLGDGDMIANANKDLNNDRYLFVKGKRCYIYSRADLIVPYLAVQKHANEAKKLGWDAMEEDFGKSKHVAHAVADGRRYWKLVEEYFGGSG
ncbi:MAG: hypothetical protein TREMPRED_003641 [Tremellales sp. Tagirdzhanova-0007]|nr:MAG: hypothetical protein TREMPRED_003641 [Tremellales sp. Tagirdzhanova-0007]